MIAWRQKSVLIAAVFLIFGALTIISGGGSLFTESGINTRGNIVPLVLWFNFISGFIYLIAGVSTFKLNSYTKRLAVVLAVSNTTVLLYLFNHIFHGGLYENKTFAAMSFRTLFWVAFAFYFQKSDIFKKVESNC